MAISATQIATTNTLENFRQQFNNLQTDVNGLESGTLTFSTLSATTTSTSALNILEDGTIVFEGATDDGNETTLTVVDPTADRTITLPNEDGTVFLTATTDSTVISNKTALTSGDVAGDTDVLLIADISGTTLKKITPNNLVSSAGGLTSVAADSTPQLGGNLDINGNDIVSTSNANIDIVPNGTGDVTLQADTVVVGDSNADATITSNGTGNLILNTNSGTNSSALTIVDAANGNIQATLNGTGVFQIDGSDGVEIQQGAISIKNGGTQSYIDFYCESSNAHYARLQAPAHSAFSGNITLTMPATTDTLVGRTTTDTLTNKTLTSPQITTSIIPSSADGATLGSASAEFSDLFLADGGTIQFGNDQEITLTHVADSGLTLKHASTSDDKFPLFTLAAGDNDIAADDVLGRIAFIAPDEGTGTDAIANAGVIDCVSEGNFSASSNKASIRLLTGESGAAEGSTGGGSLTLSSSGDLTLKDRRTSDGSMARLTLQSGDTDIAADDILGRIEFQAPDEGTGTDATVVAAIIEAVSEGDFSATSNATKLSFRTATSGTSTEKMALSSAGVLDVDGGITVDNITIDGTEIDLSSGDLTLDVAGDIVLDAGGEQVIFKDGSTNVGHVDLTNDDFILKSLVSDKDFIVKGNDGGTEITALTIDMSGAGAATFNNNVTAFSDERLKSDITTLKSSLEKVLQMRGVSYTRNDNPEGGEQIGVIAQEVEKLYPQVVLTADDEQGTKSVDYGRLTAVLIEAVKELSELVNRDISSIKKDIDAICQHPLWQENQLKGE